MTKFTNILTGPFQINTWIIRIYENFVLIIDPANNEITDDRDILKNYISENKLIPIGAILTHGHFDHILGTQILKNDFPECKIAVHSFDRELCGKNAYANQAEMLYASRMDEIAEALKNLNDKDIFLNDDETLDKVFDNKNFPLELAKKLSEWKIIHTPGHTKGSVCIYNQKEKIIFTGDTIFHGAYGRTDLPGGSLSEMKESIKKLLKILDKNTLVYPAHNDYGFKFSDWDKI